MYSITVRQFGRVQQCWQHHLSIYPYEYSELAKPKHSADKDDVFTFYALMSSSPRQPQLPRPVKKRGRYSHPAPPEGFVRYELDEEGSSEDPDFEAEEPEDDDDSLDDPQALRSESRAADEELTRILNDGREPGRPPDATPHPVLPSTLGEFASTFEAEPHYEVDDLDSSDDGKNEADKGFESVSQGPIIHDRYDLEALGDEDEDVDDVDDVDDDELEDDETDQNDAPTEREGPPDEYLQFLLGFANPEPSAPSTSEAPPTTSDQLPPSWALDDDDDFDYLRESARVQDDPLEYRDDLHVSRKELVQLLFSGNGGTLRRQTRNSRARKAPSGARALRTTGTPLPPLLPVASSTALLPVPPGTLPIAQHVPMQAMVNQVSPSFIGVHAPALHCLREQMGIYVQLLTTIHAETKRKARMELSSAGSSKAPSSKEAVTTSAVSEAASKSEKLIHRLIENARTSAMYHEMLSKNLSRLEPFSERWLKRDRRSGSAYTSRRTSVYNLPVLKLLDGFVKACGTAKVSSMPSTVLEPLRGYFRLEISQGLSARPRGRQYSNTERRAGWFPWTAEDDNLLAMTMVKYGSEYGEFSADLLPHRQEDDCQTRVRYLSSRRCADNAVKRQVMYIAAPLNRDEVSLVRRGLEMYGQSGLGEEDVWRKIESELVPNREWSHLQKLWKWRETRRRYKADSRARANERKKARQGDGAS